MLSSNVLVQPRLPFGSSQAVTATVAEWASVGGSAAKVCENDPLNVNGDPPTGAPSIDTATLLVPLPLYWVRLTLSPPSQVSETLGVCAATAAGATSAATVSAMTASHEARRVRWVRAPVARDDM